MAKDRKDSFLLYRSYFDAAEHLPDKDFKLYMLALKEYALDGVLPDFDGVLMALFVMAKPSIDAARNRYEIAVENGKKGGRPPKNKPKPEQNQSNNQNKTKGKTRIKPTPNLTVSVTEAVTESVSVSEAVTVSVTEDEAVTDSLNESVSATFSDTEDENGDGEFERKGKEKPQNSVKLDKLLSRKDNPTLSASPQIRKIGKEERACPVCGGDLIHTAGGTAHCFVCQAAYETKDDIR
jgi:hypothetical protein